MIAKDYATLIIAILGIIAGLYATRTSRQATAANRETNQIKWLQEAKSDAAAAKKEVREARDEVDQAREELADCKLELTRAKRDLISARDVTEEWTRWGLRVIDWAQDPTVDRDEIRRLINGGPPSMRGQLGRPAGE